MSLKAAEEEMAQHIPMTLQVRRVQLEHLRFFPARQRASNDGESMVCVFDAGQAGKNEGL